MYADNDSNTKANVSFFSKPQFSERRLQYSAFFFPSNLLYYRLLSEREVITRFVFRHRIHLREIIVKKLVHNALESARKRDLKV